MASSFDINNAGLNQTPQELYIKGNLRWWSPPSVDVDTAQPLIFSNRDIELGSWIQYAIDNDIIVVSTAVTVPTAYQVADIAARDAVANPEDNDTALILDSDGSGTFGVSHYDDATGWSDPVASPAALPTIYSLNGVLAGNRTVDGSTNTLTFNNLSLLTLEGDAIRANNTADNVFLDISSTTLTAESTGATLALADSANTLSISQSFTITDSRAVSSRAGLEYAADYSADFTDRTLVDKEYVDTEIVASGAATSLYTGPGTVPAATIATIASDLTFTHAGSAAIDIGTTFTMVADTDVSSIFTWGNVDKFNFEASNATSDQKAGAGIITDDFQNPVGAIYGSNMTGSEYTYGLAKTSQFEIRAINASSQTRGIYTPFGAEFLWTDNTDTNTFEASQDGTRMRSPTRVMVVTDDLYPVATTVTTSSLLQLTDVGGGGYKGHVQYTIHDYPIALPGTDSFWQFNTDGTGEFVDVATLISGSYLELTGGTMSGDIDMAGNELNGSNGNGTNFFQTIDISGSILMTATDGASDATTLSINGTSGDAFITSNYTSFPGLQYAADYSADFTNRSLVDKEYADAQNGIYGASGTVPSSVEATLTNNIKFLSATYTNYSFKIDHNKNVTMLHDDTTTKRESASFVVDQTSDQALIRAFGTRNSSVEYGIRVESSTSIASQTKSAFLEMVSTNWSTNYLATGNHTGDYLGKIYFSGLADSTTAVFPRTESAQKAVIIRGEATEDWSAGVAGAKLVIQTTPNTTTVPTDVFELGEDGQMTLNTYGSATHTGTATYYLQVDSSGNVIEGALDNTTSLAHTTITGLTYDVLITDSVIYMDATSNAVTVTLLDATTIDTRVFTLKAINADNTVTVDTDGGNIDGSASVTLSLNQSITVHSDGTNYYII